MIKARRVRFDWSDVPLHWVPDAHRWLPILDLKSVV